VIDESGFEALYRRTAAPLRAYVARVIGSAARADDIVQEAYLRLLRTPPPIDDPGQLRAYLFRTASNLIHDHWRQQQRERKSSARHSNDPETVSPDLALRLDMTRLFEQLRPQLALLGVHGANEDEARGMRNRHALALDGVHAHRGGVGARERSVRVLLHRARRKLATLLQERGAAQETRDDR